MGLRKLSNKPLQPEAPSPSDAADCESAIRRYQAQTDRPAVPHTSDATDAYSESLAPSVGTDLQTPPPTHREYRVYDGERSMPASPAPTPAPAAPAQSSSVDAFTAALDALRTTLRQTAIAPHTVPEPLAEDQTAGSATPPQATSLPIEDSAAAVIEVSDSTSALDRMPLPLSDGDSVAPNRNLYEASPDKRASRPTTKTAPRPEPVSIDSALQAVRDAVPGLNLTPPKSDTPTIGRKRPSSDGIPKSVSEDLPKYPARPRMRTCTRCGHETKLRDSKCQKCSHVDESLGILDAVIAGDLARVEQVLLVRPHLITLRTSRHDWTLLHMAASGGNPKMAELLIEKGASVDSVNRDGKTALHYAAGKGHLGIVQILLTHLADVSALYNGKSALDLARKNGHHDVEELLRRALPEE